SNQRLLTKSTKLSRRDLAEIYMTQFKKKLNGKSAARSISLDEFIELYRLRSINLYSANYKELIQWAFKSFRKYLGNKPLDDITEADCEAYRSFKLSEASEHLVRSYLSSIKPAFKYALAKDLIAINPFSNVKLPKAEENLPIFVTRSE